jgi:hypothetical protein
MFWGCFNWFQKGPFFIWKKETKKSRNEAEKELKKWNEDHEIEHKRAWEEEQRLKALTREMERVQLREQSRRRGGRVAKWRHTELTGAKV